MQKTPKLRLFYPYQFAPVRWSLEIFQDWPGVGEGRVYNGCSIRSYLFTDLLDAPSFSCATPRAWPPGSCRKKGQRTKTAEWPRWLSMLAVPSHMDFPLAGTADCWYRFSSFQPSFSSQL